MKSITKLLVIAVFVASAVAMVPARADLILSTVTGSLNLGSPPIAVNYFDPIHGLVPPGYENSSPHTGSSVTVSGTASEFGYSNGPSTIVADFGSTTLLLSDTTTTADSSPLSFTFTDSAFAGLVLSKTNDTFPVGGLTATLSGTTLTVTTNDLSGVAGSFNGIFTLMSPSAVPEPSQLTLVGVAGLLFVGRFLRRRLAA
jgi:hypothetical protein